MNWFNKQVSLYSWHGATTGRAVPIGQILRTEFVRDIDQLIDLKKLDRSDPDYQRKKRELKSSLQCYTPSGLLQTRAKSTPENIILSGLLQLDFDANTLKDYDIEEVKRMVFDLPFTAFCALSCSGDGFYALVSIAEPERLDVYAEHLFDVFARYELEPDTSKGRNVSDLRYVSYDCNMLIREEPVPLRIKHFKRKPKPIYKPGRIVNGDWVNQLLNSIGGAVTGERFATVQKTAYTLGGTNNDTLLDKIITRIEQNPEFRGDESKYIKIARDCFRDGSKKPLEKQSKKI